MVVLSMVATMTSSLSEGAWTVQCAGSLCASDATEVLFAKYALSKIQDRVVRQWCRLWMMRVDGWGSGVRRHVETWMWTLPQGWVGVRFGISFTN